MGLDATKNFLHNRRSKVSVGKDVEKSELLYTVGGNLTWCDAMENRMELPQKIKNRTTI